MRTGDGRRKNQKTEDSEQMTERAKPPGFRYPFLFTALARFVLELVFAKEKR